MYYDLIYDKSFCKPLDTRYCNGSRIRIQNQYAYVIYRTDSTVKGNVVFTSVIWEQYVKDMWSHQYIYIKILVSVCYYSELRIAIII